MFSFPSTQEIQPQSQDNPVVHQPEEKEPGRPPLIKMILSTVHADQRIASIAPSTARDSTHPRGQFLAQGLLTGWVHSLLHGHQSQTLRMCREPSCAGKIHNAFLLWERATHKSPKRTRWHSIHPKRPSIASNNLVGNRQADFPKTWHTGKDQNSRWVS